MLLKRRFLNERLSTFQNRKKVWFYGWSFWAPVVAVKDGDLLAGRSRPYPDKY